MNPAIRSKSRTACIIGLFVSLLFGWGSALAHQAIVAQLERVNDMINADPDNAEHYIKRGLLYREHLEFEQALLDFRFARELNPELPQAYYQLGRLLLETGDSAAALGSA